MLQVYRPTCAAQTCAAVSAELRIITLNFTYTVSLNGKGIMFSDNITQNGVHKLYFQWQLLTIINKGMIQRHV